MHAAESPKCPTCRSAIPAGGIIKPRLSIPHPKFKFSKVQAQKAYQALSDENSELKVINRAAVKMSNKHESNLEDLQDDYKIMKLKYQNQSLRCIQLMSKLEQAEAKNVELEGRLSGLREQPCNTLDCNFNSVSNNNHKYADLKRSSQTVLTAESRRSINLDSKRLNTKSESG